ncbi:hypothetical protein BVH03_13925 [Pseudomonas sp. PA15(2017)]|uniref:SDR family NAD(P)-dependent oxidoreductase n=1 Tax=Pseudomonas sp. PA15(2017) TaxID=1932111 RepID=UPI000967B635|nr:SDR family oxidoreductase [Pseudomonas sp. PA15(2017)]OLU27316.1 hypothetical protein BVH03_13925 [Pseudomonas sp. PA15(2017)]
MNKVIVVIGAGKGVGLEIARKFGQNGFRVGLVGRNADKLAALQEVLHLEGVESAVSVADAKNTGDLRRAMAEFSSHFGRIDVVLYNPPGSLRSAYKKALEIESVELTEFLQVRLIGALEAAKLSYPYLLESSGSLIYTSGQSDRFAYPNTAMLGVPQAGLKLMAEHLFHELQESGIFVGYTPLDNPPMYADEAEEARRDDVPEGFFLSERVTAVDVAEKVFEQVANKGPHEVRVRSSIKL